MICIGCQSCFEIVHITLIVTIIVTGHISTVYSYWRVHQTNNDDKVHERVLEQRFTDLDHLSNYQCPEQLSETVTSCCHESSFTNKIFSTIMSQAHAHTRPTHISLRISKDHVYRMVKVEGRCTQLTSSSLHTYIIIG